MSTQFYEDGQQLLDRVIFQLKYLILIQPKWLLGLGDYLHGGMFVAIVHGRARLVDVKTNIKKSR